MFQNNNETWFEGYKCNIRAVTQQLAANRRENLTNVEQRLQTHPYPLQERSQCPPLPLGNALHYLGAWNTSPAAAPMPPAHSGGLFVEENMYSASLGSQCRHCPQALCLLQVKPTGWSFRTCSLQAVLRGAPSRLLAANADSSRGSEDPSSL